MCPTECVIVTMEQENITGEKLPNELPASHVTPTRTNENLTSILAPETFRTCSGCGREITDRSSLLVDYSYWHLSCLKCSACALPLDGSTSCFVKNGNVYCRNDYYRLFSSRMCSLCGTCVEPQDWVMRVQDRVYHATPYCFFCSACQRPLLAGEQFVGASNGLMCLPCSHANAEGDFFASAEPLRHKARTKKRSSNNLTSTHLDSICGMTMNYIHGEAGGSERNEYQPPKSKRMRTSFKHHQLRAMKAYFNLNHNPDAKDLKQLSLETGLTKRVLQVWFQNARAKHRRSSALGEKEKSQASGSESKKKSDCDALSYSDCSHTSTEASPDGTESIFYDTTSHCDDIMSPYDDYQQLCAAQDAFGYDSRPFMGSTTSICSNPAQIHTEVASALESSQQAMTSPCQL